MVTLAMRTYYAYHKRHLEGIGQRASASIADLVVTDPQVFQRLVRLVIFQAMATMPGRQIAARM